MEEKDAPPLVTSEWVLSAQAEAPALDDGRWRVLAFFAPTGRYCWDEVPESSGCR